MVQNGRGDIFSPRVWASSSPKTSKNPKVSSKKLFFWNFSQQSPKIIEFDLYFDQKSFFKRFLMVLRVGTGAKWSGGYFFPPGMTSSSSKRPQNPKVSSKKSFFFNFWQKSSKIIEFDLFDGLESCVSSRGFLQKKCHLCCPSGCRD